jgi:pSer/pThr/pTyr-binding forkhead associated (FHA) protein
MALGDDDLSKRHCKIERQGAGFLLSDLHSTNGTYLNGAKVASPVELTDGDIIAVGHSRLRFVAG